MLRLVVLVMACLGWASGLLMSPALRRPCASAAHRSPIMQEEPTDGGGGGGPEPYKTGKLTSEIEKNPIAEYGSLAAFAIVLGGLTYGALNEDAIEAQVGKSAVSFPDPGKEGRELRKKGEEAARQKKLQSAVEVNEAIFGLPA